MNIGRLDEECPKCGSKDKTIKRDLDPQHRAHATTSAVICSECKYVFKDCKE
ncbi:MAG TPA: TIGR04165 family Cys-rich peptide [Methanobacterium sp.]